MKFRVIQKRDFLLLAFIPVIIMLLPALSYFIKTQSLLYETSIMESDLSGNKHYGFSAWLQPRTISLLDGNLDKKNEDFTLKVYGSYNQFTGRMTVDELLLNGNQYENLRLWTLRHEYGHALMEDILYKTQDQGGYDTYLKTFFLFQSSKFITRNSGAWIVNNFYPPELQNIYYSYQKHGKEIYGKSAYIGDNFAEFFAEGYTTFLSGSLLPEDLSDSYAKLATPNERYINRGE